MIRVARRNTLAFFNKRNQFTKDFRNVATVNFVNDKDEVFVGRIRRDYSIEKGVNLWVVSDNIRKGAATNAVQIAKYIIENFKI